MEITKIKCELCGSNDIIKDGDSFFVCQHCGTKYTVEAAQRLIQDGPVEVRGTVNIDTTARSNNMLILAARAISAGAYAEAKGYYEEILKDQPSAYTVIFLHGYADAMQSTLEHPHLDAVISASKQAIEEAQIQLSESAELDAFKDFISDKTYNAASVFYSAAQKRFDSQNMKKGAVSDFREQALWAARTFLCAAESCPVSDAAKAKKTNAYNQVMNVCHSILAEQYAMMGSTCIKVIPPEELVRECNMILATADMALNSMYPKREQYVAKRKKEESNEKKYNAKNKNLEPLVWLAAVSGIVSCFPLIGIITIFLAYVFGIIAIIMSIGALSRNNRNKSTPITCLVVGAAACVVPTLLQIVFMVYLYGSSLTTSF